MAWREAFAERLDTLLDALQRRLFTPERLRWARRSPLTRPVARRQARALFDLVSGFVYTQILLACVRLALFERLADGARGAAELAPDLGLTTEAAEQLLDGAVVIGLLRRRPSGRYALTSLGASVLASPGIRSMIEHNHLLYQDLDDPVALLRQSTREGATLDTQLGRFWPYAEDGGRDAIAPDVAAAYSALMAASQDLIADEVLDAYDLARHRVLLDIGGGNGTFIAHAARRWPHLEFRLVDLPDVVEVARGRLAEQGLADRVVAQGGNFLVDDLPTGADIATLVRVLHDQDDAGARRVLRAARQALGEGGVLLVAEPMRATRSAPRVGDAYFAFYLLAMGRGRPRSAAEITAMLHEAGFGRVRRCPTHVPLQTSLLVAEA